MESKTQFTKLVDLLPRALAHFNIAPATYAAQVVLRWPVALKNVLQLPEGSRATALHVKHGILTISVGNSATAQTIQMAKISLLKELNKDLPETRVTDIRFVQR